MRVFLLTSHPVSPPWNSGDKHLARTLLMGGTGVEHHFIALESDGAVWPADAHPVRLHLRTDVPTAGTKLRLYHALLRCVPEVDAVHSVVAYGRGRLTPAAVLLTPLVRRSRLMVTCPTGWHLPTRLVRRADTVVAISEATASRLRHLGCRQVLTVPPGINLDEWTPQDAGDARRRMGIPDVPTLLFAGHYLEGGGLEQALAVLARLRRQGEVRLVLAMRTWVRKKHSKGSPEELQAELRASGLEDSVTVLGRNPDMRTAVHAASALLFQPRQLELKTDLPITLLEGLAAGRPIVVGTAPPLPELADGSGAVTVVGTDDTEATAAALHHMLHDPTELAQRGAAARALARTRYSSERMVAGYAEAYASLSAAPGQGRGRRRPQAEPESPAL